jgi:hypothetical protein
MIELGSEFIWLWFLEEKQTNTYEGSCKGFMITAKYSTKNYVSNIVQALLSLMSLHSKIQYWIKNSKNLESGCPPGSLFLSHPDLRANPNARIHVRQDQVTHMHRLTEYQNTV